MAIWDYLYVGFSAFVLLSASSGIVSIGKSAVSRLASFHIPPVVIVKAAAIPSPTPTPTPKEDERIRKLRTYLSSKHSPLAEYASLIVSEADKNDIGWTKVAAISGKESSYGKRIPGGSYNAWGIGGSSFHYFSSWEEGIRYVSRMLGEKYKWNENKGIQAKYCPDSDGCAKDWTNTVTQFSFDILYTEE
jgi:hypothetical protein